MTTNNTFDVMDGGSPAVLDPNRIVLTDPDQLERFDLVESNLLTGLESYEMYRRRIEGVYRRLVDANPQLEYRPYQVNDAAILCTRPHHVLTHGLGLGKTTITLLALWAIYWPTTNRRPATIQIAVPNLLSAGRWTEDLERLNSVLGDAPMEFEVVRTDRQLRTTRAPIVIYNHDLPKNRCRALGGKRATISRWIRRHRRPSLLVIDEIHNCQSSSDRTRQLTLVGGQAKRRIGLTGTLTEVSHIHTVCADIIYRRLFPYHNKADFSRTFTTKTKLRTNYTGAGNTLNGPERWLRALDTTKAPDYYDLMRRFVYRVRVDDPQVRSCITVPDSVVKMWPVAATPDQLEVHQAYLTAHRHQLTLACASAKQTAGALRLIVPLVQVANATPNSNKVLKVGRLVKAAPGKVVVFCHYVASARLITEHLGALLGPEAVVRLYATDPLASPTSLSQEQQVERRSQFQFDPAIKVGVFSLNLAAQSIDLTAASDVIYYCCGWSSLSILQSLKRAVRPGNPNPSVSSHYVYTTGLIDTHQVALAVEKIRGSKLLMDFDLDDLTAADEPGGPDLSPAEAIRRLLSK